MWWPVLHGQFTRRTFLVCFANCAMNGSSGKKIRSENRTVKTIIDELRHTKFASSLEQYDAALHLLFGGMKEIAQRGDVYAATVLAAATEKLHKADALASGGQRSEPPT